MLEPLATLLLGPLFLYQGKRTLRRIPRLSEPDGARDGRSGQGAPLRLLVAGDSAAAGVGAADQRDALLGQLASRLDRHFDLQWHLVAKTGLTTEQIRETLQQVPARPFDVAVISAGVNDVLTRCDGTQWAFALEQLADVLRHRFGVRLIVFAPLPPIHRFPALPQPLRWFLGVRAKNFNRRLDDLVRARADCRVVPLTRELTSDMMGADGFHPGPPAYALWAEAAAAEIARWAAEEVTAAVTGS